MPEALSDGQPKGGLGEKALKPLDGGLLRGQSERLLSVVGKPGEEVEPFVLREVALGNITLRFLPVACYAYTVARNTLNNSGSNIGL